MASTTPFTILHAPVFDTPVVSDADLALSVHNDGGSICTLHYVILDESVPVPSASAILSHPAYDSLLVPNGPPATVLSHTFSISGTCRLHGYFESGVGVVSLVSSTAPFAVTVPVPGLHAPIFEAPMVSGADLTLTVQNGGEDTCTLHYAVLAATEDALAPGFTMGDRYGTVAVPALGTADVAISDLSEGTCRVHGYFSLAGAHSSVVRSDAFTVGPAVPVNPIVPSFSDAAVSGLAFTASVTNSGVASQTLYYVFLGVSEGLPSVTDIDTNPDRAFVTVPGFDSSNPTASLPLTHTFLVGGTYVLHGYFSDADGAASMVVSTDPFVVTAPTVVPVPIFSLPAVSGTGVTILVTPAASVTYTLHYQVLDASEDAPATGFTTGTNYGTATLSPGDDVPVLVQDLSPGSHIFYAYFSDGTSESEVSGSTAFTILSLPSFASIPVVSSVTETSAEVSFSPLDAHEYCWVLLLSGEGSPSTEQVLRGEDGNGATVAATFRSLAGGVLLSGDDPVTFTSPGPVSRYLLSSVYGFGKRCRRCLQSSGRGALHDHYSPPCSCFGCGGCVSFLSYSCASHCRYFCDQRRHY